MPRSRGFTLIELMIVLVIVTVVATLAIPLFLASRLGSQESAAVGILRNVAQAQTHFQLLGVADLNANGLGEHGTFGEMSGNVPVRAAAGGTSFLSPTWVSKSFRAISPIGEMVKGGYYFRLYLPGSSGEGLVELPGGGADAAVDPARAEALWCVYAWPRAYGSTGHRTFFLNQAGQILWTDEATYTGAGAPITPGAALAAGAPANSIEGSAAVNGVGRDGRTWRVYGE